MTNISASAVAIWFLIVGLEGAAVPQAADVESRMKTLGTDVGGVMGLLYKSLPSLEIHRAVPLLREREQFLSQLLREGTSALRVQQVAWCLLQGVRILKLEKFRMIDRQEIEEAMCKISGRTASSRYWPARCWSAWVFKTSVIRWLRFHKKFRDTNVRCQPFGKQLDSFANFMGSGNVKPATVVAKRSKVAGFLRWFAGQKKSLSYASLSDAERYLTARKLEGWTVLTRVNVAHAIKSFFRYAEMKRWCTPGIAAGVVPSRRSGLAPHTQGREWTEVESLLGSIRGQDPAAIRAKAALFLIATYALRSSEMERLQNSDFDWRNKVLTIRRSKGGFRQRYPLRPEVARAVLQYIEVRPRCSCNQLFVTIRPPYRAARHRSFYSMTRHRLKKIGILAGRMGTHSIRHARATQLLHQGMSLKQIGDFLGHRHSESPLIYTRFDVELLRPVAEFSLGALL